MHPRRSGSWAAGRCSSTTGSLPGFAPQPVMSCSSSTGAKYKTSAVRAPLHMAARTPVKGSLERAHRYIPRSSAVSGKRCAGDEWRAMETRADHLRRTQRVFPCCAQGRQSVTVSQANTGKDVLIPPELLVSCSSTAADIVSSVLRCYCYSSCTSSWCQVTTWGHIAAKHTALSWHN